MSGGWGGGGGGAVQRRRREVVPGGWSFFEPCDHSSRFFCFRGGEGYVTGCFTLEKLGYSRAGYLDGVLLPSLVGRRGRGPLAPETGPRALRFPGASEGRMGNRGLEPSIKINLNESK